MNYVVDRRERRKRDWISCSTTVVEGKYRVTELQKGTEYTFRVAAENRYGIGEFVETEPLIAQDPYTVPGAPSTPEIIEVARISLLSLGRHPRKIVELTSKDTG